MNTRQRAFRKSAGFITTSLCLSFFSGSAYAQYSVAPVTDGGSIVGVVTYEGDAPAPKKIQVTKDVAICSKTAKYEESLLVDEKGGIANVVVSITKIARGKDFPDDASYQLDQNGCRFVPHVQVLQAGVRVTILNSDGVLHNIHTFSVKNPPINKAQPKFKKRIRHTFDVPEIVNIKCDAHGWMSAWVAVAAHPYYAVTDDSGSFRLDDVPPGTYTLEFWHEKLDTMPAEVTIVAGDETTSNVVYKVAE